MSGSTYNRLRRVGLLFAAIIWLSSGAVAQKVMRAVDKELPLSAEQTARATKLLPLFDHVKELAAHPDPKNRMEMLVLQQQLLTRVTSASLQVDAAKGQIDWEIAETKELENYLSTHRNSKVDLINLISLGVGGTAGTASSALGFTAHDRAATVTGVVAGATTAALSLMELRVRRGESRKLTVPSNMLSGAFGSSSNEKNVYPQVVVAFLHAVPPNDVDGLSRQNRLIRNWVQVGRIPKPDSPKGREKIEHLTSLPGEKIKQSIGDLDDRQAMLYNLRVRLSYIKLDLATLLSDLPTMAMQAQGQPATR